MTVPRALSSCRCGEGRRGGLYGSIKDTIASNTAHINAAMEMKRS